VRGRFVWHELLTRDVPAAKKFYAALTGWKALPWPLNPDYIVCHADPGPVAGMQAIGADMPAEMPAHWLPYIGTRDVDGTADQAVRAGGSVVKPPDTLSGAGRYAVLKDPQGAIFAVLDPEKAHPEAEQPPLGDFTWHELATSDHEAAFAFYSSLFGWSVLQRMDMGANGVYLIFGWNGLQRGGIYTKSADWPAPPNWVPYAHVPDVDAQFAWAKGEGARELFPPMEVPGGSRVAAIVDPTGAAFAIHTPPAAVTPAASAKPKARTKTKAKPKAKPKAKRKAKKNLVRAAKPARQKKVARKAAKKPPRKVRRVQPKRRAAAKKKSGKGKRPRSKK
jgi:predicted enzyme related to lactoylglutathione lyase